MPGLAQRADSLPAPWCAKHHDLPSHGSADEDTAESVYSLCSQQSSTDLTASDLPGAGRTLGLLYSRWGKALEVSIGRIAHKSGFGPDAVASRIERATFRGTWVKSNTSSDEEEEDGAISQRAQRVVDWNVTDGNEAKLRADCQKLVAYSTAEIQQTRVQALHHIIRLTTGQPRLRAFFNTPSNITTLRAVTKPSSISSCGPACPEQLFKDHLKTTSLAKAALLSIEDNAMNAVVDNIMQLPFARYDSDDSRMFARHYTVTMTKLLEFCRHPRYAFVAKRHMCNALNYLPLTAICQFSSALIVFLEKVVAQVLNIINITSRSSTTGLDPGATPAAVPVADVDGTERLVEVLLLPRCRIMHTLNPDLGLRVLSWVNPEHCRCTENGRVHEEMSGLLGLLQSPTAQKVFPRAAAIAQDMWTSA